MSRHKIVYETRELPEIEALEITGSPTLEYDRIRMDKFLTDNEWDVDVFRAWLPYYKAGVKFELPSKTEMVKNVAVAGKQAVLSGFKKVSEEEQQRRHAICKGRCPEYREGRCAQCGCWTTYKTKLKAWHCPIGKW